MSELTWYSRFAVWVGTVVLLVQSIAQRGAGLMSLVAVLLMAGGLLVFLFGLIADERAARMASVPEEADADVQPVTATGTVNAPAVVPPAEAHRSEGTEVPAEVEPAETEPTPPAIATALEAVDSSPSSGVEVSAQPSSPATQIRVRTEELATGNWLVEVPCVRCGRSLGEGSVVAFCPVCGRPQHASCWIENHFHCSNTGCGGHGSLEAPPEPAEG